MKSKLKKQKKTKTDGVFIQFKFFGQRSFC